MFGQMLNTLLVFMKDFILKVDFEKYSRPQKIMNNFPA